MSTLTEATQRLELNQASRTSTLEQLSGEKLVLWQGLGARIECALFRDTPESSSFITDVSNLDSVNIVVRKNSPNGDILFTKDGVISTISYSSWVANTATQLLFHVEEVDTTQIVPPSGRLPIYFVVTVITNDNVPYVAGFGFGEIVDVGYIENPVAVDYITGRTNIVGGKLLTDLDLFGHRIVDSVLGGYIEEGSVTLGNQQSLVTVDFQYDKPTAEGYRFEYLYIVDALTGEASDGIPKIKSQTTTHFVVRFTQGTQLNSTLYWKTEPASDVVIPEPAPRYILDESVVHLDGDEELTGFKDATAGIGAPFIRGRAFNPKDTAFAGGAKGDGVTDDGAALNAFFAAVEPVSGINSFELTPGIYLTNTQISLSNTTNEGFLQGLGNATIIKAGPSFPTNAALIKGGSLISAVTLKNFALNLNNRAAIGIDLTRTESSIRHKVTDILVSSIPTNGKGFVLDGCEDTRLQGCETVQQNGATGVRSIQWTVPGGNAWISNCTFFNNVYVSGQQISIRDSTTGGIVANGFISQLLCEVVYGYASTGSVKANVWCDTGGSVASAVFDQCQFNPTGQNNVVAFQGSFYLGIDCRDTVFDATGQTGYTVIGSTTLAESGYNPNFVINTLRLLTGATVGTPAAGVTSNNWVNATLQNSWVNHPDDGYALASYMKDKYGFVTLRGHIKDGTTTINTFLLTLPEGYRPATNVIFPVQSGSGLTALTVDSGGHVYPTFGSNATISLSGIRFQAV